MKKFLCLTLGLGVAALLTPGCSHAPKPPVVVQEVPASTPSGPRPSPPYSYEQKLMGGQPALVTPDQAQAIIGRFRDAYPKLGSPRLLIYVNRELVDAHSGMKIVRRNEHVESSRSTEGTNGPASTIRSTADNTYRPDDKPQPTLADKQTVRDVERLFGRPLRAAGATLVDQKVATDLIADRPLDEFIGTTDTPQAQKDREALGKIADTVIEILIASKNVTSSTISGDRTITVPDIQATAINLKDSKILAQTSSGDVTARVSPSTLAGFGVQEITEATALELMEDLSSTAK